MKNNDFFKIKRKTSNRKFFNKKEIELPKINTNINKNYTSSVSPNLLQPMNFNNNGNIFKNDYIRKNTKKKSINNKFHKNKITTNIKNNREIFYEEFEEIIEEFDLLKKNKKTAIKKRKYTNLFELIPNNVKEEEEKFYLFNKNYNPYFKYKIEKINFKIKKPDIKLLNLSIKILDEVVKEYGSFDLFFENFGKKLNQNQTIKNFDRYISELDLLDYIKYNFTEKAIAPTCVTHNNNGSTIIVKLPINYREFNINCVLNHEVGTHILRKLNERQQIWNGKRKKYKLENFLEIEEGLATINQLIGYQNDKLIPFLMMPAIYYYAAYLSSIMSFQELYNTLKYYIKDENLLWRYCLRVKRGIIDTSFPGGMYKDQAYFIGAYKILKNRNKINFKLLYSGKITLKDLDKLNKQNLINEDKIKLPKFMENMNFYLYKLDRIAKYNFIDQF